MHNHYVVIMINPLSERFLSVLGVEHSLEGARDKKDELESETPNKIIVREVEDA